MSLAEGDSDGGQGPGNTRKNKEKLRKNRRPGARKSQEKQGKTRMNYEKQGTTRRPGARKSQENKETQRKTTKITEKLGKARKNKLRLYFFS